MNRCRGGLPGSPVAGQPVARRTWTSLQTREWRRASMAGGAVGEGCSLRRASLARCRWLTSRMRSSMSARARRYSMGEDIVGSWCGSIRLDLVRRSCADGGDCSVRQTTLRMTGARQSPQRPTGSCAGALLQCRKVHDLDARPAQSDHLEVCESLQDLVDRRPARPYQTRELGLAQRDRDGVP
jgi:hypothetical protein